MECFNSTKLSSPCTSSILNLQGSSSLVCNKFSKNSVHPWLLSSPPPKPIFQLDDRLQYRQKSAHRTYRGPILAEAGKQGWDLGPKKSMESSGIVLVVGATGGVGRRVVDVLQKKGLPVRVLARNEEKARKMLGPDIDLIIGDITKESTLLPEYFKGVRKVINAASVIVGPKEGDTPEREKYSQGIKFFEPEIKGDSPEMVEFVGMRNLINAVKGSVGLRNGKLLFGCEDNGFRDLAWGALDDVVMGGVSESTFIIDTTGGEKGGPAGLFKGVVSTTNNGGFTSIRTKNFSVPEDLSSYDGLELRLKGDGRRYKLIVRTSRDWDTVGYTASFDTTEGQWQSIRLPFSSFVPVFRARTVSDAPPFDPRSIVSLQLMFSKFEYDGKLNPTFVEGPFQLPVSSIRTFIKDPVTPRFVHVSSAGVTRPDRPGLDLSKQPPAVRLNKELDFILTFKLKGEDLIRESGIPYAIVRPCALTEEPAGADLIFDQGDNITGKISREEIARICIAALESPYALDKTFEVKSVIPFSEPFTVDLENPPQEKDYDIYFKDLKDGITGKELLEQSPVPV
ncbi:protein HIGH CHLOROPHYLL FLUORESCENCE PHENOTYPE 173, chloroplastic isoform X2 [Populus alba]|uniref:protein HIGH CHLOROPHYLL FLUORESCENCE PHENOTYPE 173, chloroplastic isoform X2 n=1 Tax=Populus alba TaxID=43335 RepID=UPI003CC6FB6F